MKNYVLSAAARVDLIEIWNYVAERNIGTADALLTEFHSAFELLSHSPGIGHLRKDLTPSNLRFWPVHHYLIIYQENSQIEVIRVLSGFRDIAQLLTAP